MVQIGSLTQIKRVSIIGSEVRSFVREKLKIAPRGGEKINGLLAESQREAFKGRSVGFLEASVENRTMSTL